MFRCHYCGDWISSGKNHLNHPYHTESANRHIRKGVSEVHRQSDSENAPGSSTDTTLDAGHARRREELEVVTTLDAGKHQRRGQKRSRSPMEPVGADHGSEVDRRARWYYKFSREARTNNGHVVVHVKQPYQCQPMGDRRDYAKPPPGPRFVRSRAPTRQPATRQPAGLWTGANRDSDNMAPTVPDRGNNVIEGPLGSARNPGSQFLLDRQEQRHLWQETQEDNEDTQRRLCQETQVKVYRLKEECALAKADLARKRREVCTSYETMSPQPEFRRRHVILTEGPYAGGNSSMGDASVPPAMSPPLTAPPGSTSDWNNEVTRARHYWNKWSAGQPWNKWSASGRGESWNGES